MQNNKIEYKYMTIWTEDEDDVLISTSPPDLKIDINIAKELVKSRLDYSKGKSIYTLVDMTNTKSVTKEARDYMSDPQGGLKGILGGAFLSNSLVAIVLINLYLKINQPLVPAKFFTKKDDAINWLKELKIKHQSQ